VMVKLLLLRGEAGTRATAVLGLHTPDHTN